MEYYENKLAIRAMKLVELGVFTRTNYDNLVRRSQLTVLRRGCNGTPALVDWESMPERFKRDTIAKLGKSPYKLVQHNQIEEHIEDNSEALDFFANFRLDAGRYLPKKTQREYYANAIVLDAIHRIISNRRAKRAALSSTAKRAWEQLSEGVQELCRLQYPHNLPANPRRLEDRYKRYMKEGAESLIHRNFQNKNAARLDDDVKESVVFELLADGRNLDNAQVARLYNVVAGSMNWKTITPAVVANIRAKHEMEIHIGRRGTVAFSNEKAMQVKRRAPQFPLYFWTLDGWDVELMYQRAEGRTITYTNRPTVVVVLDPCCKYPIGYAVGERESADLIRAALQHAVKHTAELFGAMHRPQQLQSDRYAIKKMMPLYEGVSEKVTPARARNAKAKVIEPYFNHINKTYCQLMLNWSGFNITSRKDKQPNTEQLNTRKHMFPDFAGVIDQVSMIMEREREAKREEYLARWAEMPNEHRLPMSYEQYLRTFGETTGHRNLMQGNGLKITINGVLRDYDCFDINFRKHSTVRWQVRYDSDDLYRVLAVNEDESLRFMLEEKHVQPMALIERGEGDSEQLERIRTYNKELVGHIMEEREKRAELASEPLKILDTLQKLQITDSRGQHKDRRNAGRALNKTDGRPSLQGAAEDVSFETPNPLKGAKSAADWSARHDELDEFDIY